MKLIKKYYITLIIIFYSFYSLLLILRSSFTINGVRHFVLFDDEMISMKYANNFAHGFGLVWNQGTEKVEGFTNLLWTLYMALFHLFPIPREKISLVIQISGMIFLAINIVFVKKIAEFITNKSLLQVFLSVIFTAFYFPLNNWSVVLGTEVSILTLFTSIAVFLALKSVKEKKFSFLLYLILGLGTLVRMDMVIPSLTIIFFLLFVDKENRINNLLFGLPFFFFFIFSQTLFRIWYYKEMLPNTYYLKLTGFPAFLRITRGIYVAFNFMSSVIFLIPLLLLKFKRNKYILLLFAVFTSQLTYSIYIGGDVWEYFGGSNRYISIVMPLFFVLFSAAFFEVYSYLNQTIKRTTILKIAATIF
ncbi:MAG: hypothetical protein HYT83_02980, partial [Candidatus Levybacteria bacterium]|nr:hypothetical protein [Candidatus Levybacteria bacterium]